jgi:hypothetical protein
MSTQTVVPPQAPFHQWQNFYVTPAPGNGAPYFGGYNASDVPTLRDQIYATVTGIAEQQKQQAANDIARDILRAVDHNGMQNLHATERNASMINSTVDRNGASNMSTTERASADIIAAVERNGANNMSTTERVNSQLATAVERNGANGAATTERVGFQVGSAVERNGALNMSTTERAAAKLASAIERNVATNQYAIDRTTGEARRTTVVTDAASRQAANDSARDITKAIDNYGLLNMSATKDTHNGLLSAIERNSSENRVQTLTSSGILGTALTDVRHSILNDVNRGTNELLASSAQYFSNLSKQVSDSAWESRNEANLNFKTVADESSRTRESISSKISDSFNSLQLEQQKLGQHLSHHASAISSKMGDNYASMLLEQQKMGQFLASKADSHFAMNTLEVQKVKEGIMSQSAQQFAMTQLELHKVKECLAAQASQNHASAQLEAQKVRESLSTQLADAKYEQLKSQQFIADKVTECCCSVKDKMNTIDRDNLRDNLGVSRDKNNMLEMLEYQQLYWGRGNFGPCGSGYGPWGGYGGYGGYGPWGGDGPRGGRGGEGDRGHH